MTTISCPSSLSDEQLIAEVKTRAGSERQAYEAEQDFGPWLIREAAVAGLSAGTSSVWTELPICRAQPAAEGEGG